MTWADDDRDLIQADIDRTAGEKEHAALRRRAASDPAFAEELSEMRRLAEILARVEPVIPPPDLAEGILRAVRTSPAEDRRGIVARLRDALPSGRGFFPYAYAAAVGAAACFLALQAVGWGIPDLSPVPPREAAGTMAPVENNVLARIDLRSAGVSGTASLQDVGGTIALDVDFEGTPPAAIGLRFDPSAVDVISVGAAGSRLGRVDVTSGLVSFTAPPSGRVTVLLARRGTGPAEVSVAAGGPDGELRPAGVLRLPAGPAGTGG